MTANPQPNFLRGTFAWSVQGYAFAEPPPSNLLAPETLSSRDPWLRVAAILEHAKRGDHRHIPRLMDCLHPADESGVPPAAIQLIGDAGRDSDLALLQELMANGPDEFRVYAAQAASMAGRISLVPSMLDAWTRVMSRDHHDMVGDAISTLLESPGGAITANAGSYRTGGASTNPDRNASRTEFEALVVARLDEVKAQHGDGKVIWQGHAFHATGLAQEMQSLLRDPNAGPFHGLFIWMRHKLEAASGFDGAACFRKGVLQPLSAAATLEKFLERDAHDEEVGVRYFFGHPISA